MPQDSSISSLTAAQLANAAYPGQPVPDGWKSLGTFSSGESQGFPAGTSSVTAFQNKATGQIVISFKGTDNLSNFQSDLGSSGGSAWVSLQAGTTTDASGNLVKPQDGGAVTLADWYSKLQNNYAGYTFITDGHSLGGGMAQTFALENQLSGYGFNSLSIPSAAESDSAIVKAGGFSQQFPVGKQTGTLLPKQTFPVTRQHCCIRPCLGKPI